MRVAIKTLGCKANRYESDEVFRVLKEKYSVFEMNEGASSVWGSNKNQECDLVIVNTCTVTNTADRKSRQSIRSIKKLNPQAKVVVFGCASNVAKKEYEEMNEVDFRASNRDEVISFAHQVFKENLKERACAYETTEHKDVKDGFRTRALLKIQDGCNSFCSYCIIPFTRGPELPFNSKMLVEEVKKMEKQGYLEIVLTGINIGEWKENEMVLADLVELLINSTSKVRFRISSIEPKNFSEKLFTLFSTGRLCPHMHMSAQSGCDSILKRMRRHYLSGMFKDVCKKFRKSVPDIALTTDMIIGFPGETEEEFMETYNFCKEIGFSKIHVFPYSRRKNTAAAKMKDQVPEDIKSQRCSRLRKLGKELELAFYNSCLGKEYFMISEQYKGDNMIRGFTENYIPVEFSGNQEMENRLFKVKLKKISSNGRVEAEIV